MRNGLQFSQVIALSYLGRAHLLRLEKKPTEDVEAYQLYLKGRYALESLSDWDNAIRYLRQAVARDPSNAPAYLGLAEYYQWVSDWTLPSREAMPRCREAAEKALQLDPSLAEAHVWLAIVRWWYDRDLDGARSGIPEGAGHAARVGLGPQVVRSLLGCPRPDR
jgi:tetratricopeptide (TPR) repeat protein